VGRLTPLPLHQCMTERRAADPLPGGSDRSGRLALLSALLGRPRPPPTDLPAPQREPPPGSSPKTILLPDPASYGPLLPNGFPQFLPLPPISPLPRHEEAYPLVRQLVVRTARERAERRAALRWDALVALGDLLAPHHVQIPSPLFGELSSSKARREASSKNPAPDPHTSAAPSPHHTTALPSAGTPFDLKLDLPRPPTEIHTQRHSQPVLESWVFPSLSLLLSRTAPPPGAPPLPATPSTIEALTWPLPGPSPLLRSFRESAHPFTPLVDIASLPATWEALRSAHPANWPLTPDNAHDQSWGRTPRGAYASWLKRDAGLALFGIVSLYSGPLDVIPLDGEALALQYQRLATDCGGRCLGDRFEYVRFLSPKGPTSRVVALIAIGCAVDEIKLTQGLGPLPPAVRRDL
jgi:hypothetical protein